MLTSGAGQVRGRDAAQAKAQMKGPLEGLVVADFTRILAGPYATMLLADLGATVIKVESPSGDDTRTWQPPARDGEATYYLGVNRNKHAIALNLKDPHDLETAHRIVAKADVFMENFRPGGLKQFGLDPQSVRDKHPHVVHASITGFGSRGGADMPGYDLLAQATSGFMSLTGEPDGDPQRGGVAIFDIMAGLHAAVGVLAALRQREQTGRGQHIEVNLLSSALSGLANQTSGFVGAGAVPFRMGNDHPSLFPYGPFMCSDRHVVICVGNDRQFALLAKVLDAPELADNEDYATMPARNRNRDALRPLLEQQLARATADEWAATFRKVGLPASPILGVDEGVAFADSLGLDPVMTPEGNPDGVPTVRTPLWLSDVEPAYRKEPPRIDEDRDAILAWLKD